MTIGPNIRRDFVPDAYLLCLTGSYQPDLFKKSFGAFCCEIADSGKFFQLVTERLTAHLAALGHPIGWNSMGYVRYRERSYQRLQPSPGPPPMVKLRYRWQDEARMAWIAPTMPASYGQVTLEVPGLQVIVRRLP